MKMTAPRMFSATGTMSTSGASQDDQGRRTRKISAPFSPKSAGTPPSTASTRPARQRKRS